VEDRDLFKLTLHNVSLFSHSPVARKLLHAMADVTGINPAAFLAAERHMTTQGSLAPLKALLLSPIVQASEKLKFRFGTNQKMIGQPGQPPQLRARMTFDIATARGSVVVQITARMVQQPNSTRQVAIVNVSYRINAGSLKGAFNQRLTVASGGQPPKSNGQTRSGSARHFPRAA
jgi:hypothetical protein